MYLDALTLVALAEELRDRLEGGRVQAIVPVDALTLVFEIYRGQRHYLLISADPQTARVHLAAKGRRGVERETPFLLLLRKYLMDSRVTRFFVPSWERILEIEFAGEEGRHRLVAEIMGRLSNIILVDEEGLVRDSARRITPEMTRARVVLPRQPYVPPPPMDRSAPDELTEPVLDSLLAGAPTDRPVWRVLTSGLRGLSPLAAREIVFRALGDAEAPVGKIDHLRPLIDAAVGLVTSSHLTPHPSIVHRPSSIVYRQSSVFAFAPYHLTHLPDAQPTDNLNAAVADFFSAQVGRDAYAAARSRVQTMIEAARDKALRQRAALEREISAPEAIERQREWGEWLLAYASLVPPRASEFTITETGGAPLLIPLDPKLSAVENAQRYFREYERAKRAGADLDTRLESISLSLASLDQLLTDLTLAETRPEIDAVHAQFAALVGEKAPQTRGGKPSGPIEVKSPDGLTILVGRNSRQNDHLTFERAVGHDLWLHARAIPGAHVIIKSEGRAVPERTLAAAASLAAHYSAARGSTQVAVDVTEVRRVKRLKGGGPGLVTYTGERTIYAEPKPATDLSQQ